MSGPGTACTVAGINSHLVVSLLVEDWKRKYSLRNLQNNITSVSCHTICDCLPYYVRLGREQLYQPHSLAMVACLTWHYTRHHLVLKLIATTINAQFLSNR